MIHDPRLSFDELNEVPLFGTIVIISVLLSNGVHTSTSVKILKVIISIKCCINAYVVGQRIALMGNP